MKALIKELEQYCNSATANSGLAAYRDCLNAALRHLTPRPVTDSEPMCGQWVLLYYRPEIEHIQETGMWLPGARAPNGWSRDYGFSEPFTGSPTHYLPLPDPPADEEPNR